MPIDHKKLLAADFGEVEHRYTARDTMLYALGVGLGADPLDEKQLRFVYERNLAALPTMPVVLAHPREGLKNPEFGIDYTRVVHGEQSLTIHAPLPAEGVVKGRSRVTQVIDKGAGKGALIYIDRELRDGAGKLLATIAHTVFVRGAGGFGGPSGPGREMKHVPMRTPDLSCTLPTLPQAALIYRLSGDYNPLHSDPAFARKAGFERPILHGLATYGVAGHAILKTMCDYEPARLKGLEGRFSSPVFPGEALTTEMWREPDRIAFRVRVHGRDAVAIDYGSAVIQS